MLSNRCSSRFGSGCRLALGAALLAALATPAASHATAYSVTNVNDSGAGSLRQAILNANANASPPHSISFSIAGTGPHTITLATALPQVTRKTSISASGEAISGAPGVVLDGDALGSGADGLSFGADADESSVAYLAIVNFPGDGIEIEAANSTVSNNYIGLGADGTTDAGNTGVGVRVIGTGNIIGTGTSTRNVISGNGSDGILFTSTSGFSYARGNRIGTNAAGTAAVPNSSDGIEIQAAFNGVGGNGASFGNLISGNGSYGIRVTSTGNFGAIQGNVIGLDAAGTGAIPNGSGGVLVAADDVQVGSTDPTGRNVITGNTGTGLTLDSASDEVLVYGNYIGTNVAGDAKVGSQSNGIQVKGGSSNCSIGGTTAAHRNVVSGNSSFGLQLDGTTSGCFVRGNYFGLNAAGTAAIGNGTGVSVGGSNHLVGGTTAAERNVMSGNTSNGIALNAPTNQVIGNYVGTDPAGSAAIPNANGVQLANSTGGVLGGTIAGEGNLISGNTNTGVTLNASAEAFSIQGNRIGTNAAGNAAVPNGYGVWLRGSGNTLGGTTAAARNVVSGNINAGVTVEGTLQKVSGNYIGVDTAGTTAIPNGGGMTLSGSANTVGGASAGERNVISGNGSGGISIYGADQIVRGNYIGTDATGAVAVANGSAAIRVLIASNGQIGGSAAGEGNLISGNSARGLVLDPESSGFTIQGNRIGTNAAGSAAVGNAWEGITIDGSGHTVGGTSAGARNLISGNGGGGIDVAGTGNSVLGNYIGTNAAGSAAIPNDGGLALYGSGHLVGGATAGARNVISGNSGNGIYATGSGHVISGNYVGTTADGSAALGNGTYGLRADEVDNLIVGGDTSAQGNVFAGNVRGVNFGYGSHDNFVYNNVIGLNATMTTDLADTGTGIELGDSYDNTIGAPGKGNVIAGMTYHGIGISGAGSTGNLIQGNWIGTNKVAATTLGNDFAGIFVTDSSGNTIGGTGAGEGNVLAHNYQFGIWVERGEGNEISGNSIYGNFFGIDIDQQGFFPNDGGDGDDGGNRAMNYPLISSAMVDGGATEVLGLLINEPNTEYRVEFFSSPTCGNAGFGQGKTFRGSAQVTTGGGGQAPIATSIPQAIADDFLSATVTDPYGNTSEFSPCVQVDLGEAPGKFQFDRQSYVGYELWVPTVKLFVTRSHGMSGTATVNLTTSNGSALAGSDFTDSDQTLTFEPWEVVKIVEIPILYEAAIEPNPESFNLALSSPSPGATLGTPIVGDVTLWDYRDEDPGVFVSDAFVDEGDGEEVFLTFDVRLTPSDHEVKVTYLVEPGSALDGQDYEAEEGILTFPPSATEQIQQVQVSILGDAIPEPDEIVWLRITTAANGGHWIAYDTFGRGEIRNDDFDAQNPVPGNVIFADGLEIGSTALWSSDAP